MHKKLVKHILHSNDDNAKDCLEEIIVDIIDDLKREDYEKYKHIEYKLYRSVYDEHLNEELAHKWVSEMKNKDGTHGEHWSIEQTSPYADGFNKYDWYAIMNMMYSTHYNPKFDTSTYIELAKDWLKDEDTSNDKALNYYLYVKHKK